MPIERKPSLYVASATAAAVPAFSAVVPGKAAAQMNGKWVAAVLSEELGYSRVVPSINCTPVPVANSGVTLESITFE